MSKLHCCRDGMKVVDKVILYQETKSNDDYRFIYEYYENYKEKWYMNLLDYIDRPSFDSDFDFKLCKAVETFNAETARILCDKYNWGFLGAFNRWFYAVLRNWKSNVKTSAYRQKKRPPVPCPVCGRLVTKIDEIHLQHYKTKGDLPKVFSWKGSIYAVATSPKIMAISWGEYSLTKMRNINNGDNKAYTKQIIDWPWFTNNGDPGVVCPFRKKIIPQINEDYIKTLPKEHGRYARSMSWQDFIEEYSYPILIQSEIYSLDYNLADDESFLKNSIEIKNENIGGHQDINKDIGINYEHVFYLIESCMDNETDQKILKLAAVGHSDADIATILDIKKAEVKTRKKEIKINNGELRLKLMESV